MYCSNCGKEVDDSAKFCSNCGCQLAEDYTEFYTNRTTNNKKTEQADMGNMGLAVLSFFFPIVGIILFICMISEKPKTAKQCLIGSLISIALNALSIVLFMGIL